jgi:hypothetical protein
MAAKPADNMGRLRPGEFRKPGPGSVPRHRLRRRVAACGPPADIELPGNPRDRPPVPWYSACITAQSSSHCIRPSCPVPGFDTATVAGGTVRSYLGTLGS